MPVAWDDFEAVDAPQETDWNEFEAVQPKAAPLPSLNANAAGLPNIELPEGTRAQVEAGQFPNAAQAMAELQTQMQQPPRSGEELAARNMAGRREMSKISGLPVSDFIPEQQPLKTLGGDVIIPAPQGFGLPTVKTPPEAGLLEKVSAGTYNTAAGAANFFLSPAGIATLLAPEVLPAKIVAPALRAAFTAMLTKSAAEQAGTASVTKDPQDITEAALGAGMAGYTGLGKLPGVGKPAEPQPQGPLFGRSLATPAGAVPTDLMQRMQGPPLPPPVVKWKPEVPGTPAPPRMNLVEEIRQAKADTIGKIQQLFPQSGLSREQARRFRDMAFPKEATPAQKASKSDFVADDSHPFDSQQWRIRNGVGPDDKVEQMADGGWVSEAPATEAKSGWGKFVRTVDKNGNGKLLFVRTAKPLSGQPAPPSGKSAETVPETAGEFSQLAARPASAFAGEAGSAEAARKAGERVESPEDLAALHAGAQRATEEMQSGDMAAKLAAQRKKQFFNEAAFHATPRVAAKQSGWTFNPQSQYGGMKIEGLEPELVPFVQKQWEFTDKRKDSPIEGITVYLPEGTPFEAVMERLRTKTREVLAARAPKPEAPPEAAPAPQAERKALEKQEFRGEAEPATVTNKGAQSLAKPDPSESDDESDQPRTSQDAAARAKASEEKWMAKLAEPPHESRRTAAQVKGRYAWDHLKVETQQRPDGNYEYTVSVQFSSQGFGNPWEGNFPTREAAAREGAHEVLRWMQQARRHETKDDLKVAMKVNAALEPLLRGEAAPEKESHTATTVPTTAAKVSREEIGDRPGAASPPTRLHLADVKQAERGMLKALRDFQGRAEQSKSSALHSLAREWESFMRELSASDIDYAKLAADYKEDFDGKALARDFTPEQLEKIRAHFLRRGKLATSADVNQVSLQDPIPAREVSSTLGRALNALKLPTQAALAKHLSSGRGAVLPKEGEPLAQEPEWLGRPLSHWQQLDVDKMTPLARFKLARTLGVENKPKAIKEMLQRRVAEIKAAPPKPKDEAAATVPLDVPSADELEPVPEPEKKPAPAKQPEPTPKPKPEPQRETVAGGELEQLLKVPEGDAPEAREAAKYAARQIAQLREELKPLEAERKKIEESIYTGRGYHRRIKRAAKKQDVKAYGDLGNKTRELYVQITSIEEGSRKDRQAVEQADYAKRANNAALPLLNRVAARVSMHAELGKEIPQKLSDTFKQLAGEEVRKRFPDATGEEVEKLAPEVERAARLNTDLDREFELNPALDVQKLRRAQLDAALNAPGHVSFANLPPKLQERITRFSNVQRAFGDTRPIEKLGAEDVADLSKTIRTESEAIQKKEKAEQAELARKEAEDKQKAEQMFAEAQDIADSKNKTGTKGGASAKGVKDELLARVEKALAEAPETYRADDKPGFVVIAVPGDGTFRFTNTKGILSGVLERMKRLKTNAGEGVQVKRTAQTVTPPKEIKNTTDFAEAVDFFELEGFNTIADRSNALADLAKKVNPENPEAVTVNAVHDFIKQKRAREAAKAEPQPTVPTEEAPPEEPKPPKGPGMVGMGGATRSEFSTGTIEDLITGDLAPERERSAPRVSPSTAPVLGSFAQALKWSWENARGWLGGIAGKTFPRTTVKDQKAGELGARWVSSQAAARPMAEVFAADVLGNTGLDPVEFGAALTEDNLRSIKDAFQTKSDEAANRDEMVDDLRGQLEALKDMDDDDPRVRSDRQEIRSEISRISKLTDEDARMFEAKAKAVRSFVGAEDFPFKSEAEYDRYLDDPRFKEAVARHRQLWDDIVGPMYKEAMGLDPDVELPSRGLATGARINLKAWREGTEPRNVVGTRRGNLLGTLRRKSPFGVEAKGTGEAYHIDYYDLMENTFGRQLEIANKNKFERQLVAVGQAVEGRPGQRVMIEGRPATEFPLKRRTLAVPGKPGVSQNKSIYINKPLVEEYKNAANVDMKPPPILLRGLTGFFNAAALAAGTDATTHVVNQVSTLATLPGASGRLLHDSLLSAVPGRPDVWVSLGRALVKGFGDNRAQIASLSEIGGMRPKEEPTRIPGLRQLSQGVHWMDRTTRLALDDAYKRLAADGLVEDSETARREFVNQIGQYNKRAQGYYKRWFRDTGLGPFVTAGTTFNTLGVRGLTLNPGVKATSAPAALALRLNMAAKLAGTVATVALLNYLLTKDKGGGVMGRPGVPIGDIDLGTEDKNGRPNRIAVFSMIGPGRGLRVTGARGLLQAKMMGLPTPTALDAAVRDAVNSAMSPWSGPAVKAAMLTVTGHSTAVDVGRESRVVSPGESQVWENAKEAMWKANPLVAGVRKANEPGSAGWTEAFKSQLPRFLPQPGRPLDMMRDYPGIVRRAQANAFIEDVIGRARKMEPTARREFLLESLRRLEDARDRERALKELKFRKVI